MEVQGTKSTHVKPGSFLTKEAIVKRILEDRKKFPRSSEEENWNKLAGKLKILMTFNTFDLKKKSSLNVEAIVKLHGKLEEVAANATLEENLKCITKNDFLTLPESDKPYCELFPYRNGDTKYHSEPNAHKVRKITTSLEPNKTEGYWHKILSTVKILQPGQNIWGSIRTFRDFEMVIDLPNWMSGTVPISMISDAYSERINSESNTLSPLSGLFVRGQYLIFKVDCILKHKVTLSIMPNHVNEHLEPEQLMNNGIIQCAVKSIEDKGYIMDVGVFDIRTAFLKFKNLPKGVKLQVGSVILCTIKDMKLNDYKFILKLSAMCNNDAVVDLTTQNLMSIIGNKVRCKITEINDTCVSMKIGQHYGMVLTNSLGRQFDLSSYHIGQSVIGRVLYVDKTSKNMLFISFNPDLCTSWTDSIRTTKTLIEGDSILQGIRVHSSGRRGLCLQLSNGSYGFCDLWRIQKLGEVYFPGMEVNASILGYSHIDLLYDLAIHPYSQKQKASDVKVGDKWQVIVEGFQNQMLQVVSYKKKLIAYVLPMHYPEECLLKGTIPKIGSKFIARVWSTSCNGHSIFVTLNSQLVNSKGETDITHKHFRVGMVTDALVTNIKQYVLQLSFFGGVTGFLHCSTLLKYRIRAKFSDVMNVQFTRFITDLPTEISMKYLKGPCQAVIVSINTFGIHVNIENNKQLTLPFWQLSDSLNINIFLKTYLRPGDTISNALLLDNNEGDIELTLKPLMCSWRPNSHSSVMPGCIVECGERYVCVVDPLGNRHILDESKMPPKIDLWDSLCIGQLIPLGCITSESFVEEYLCQWELEYLNNRLVSDGSLIRTFSIRDADFCCLNQLNLLHSYKCEVLTINNAYLVVRVEPFGVKGFLLASTEKTHQIGVSLQATIVRLSLLDKYAILIEDRHGAKKFHFSCGQNITLNGQQVECKILFKKEDYYIGELFNCCPGHFVFLPHEVPITSIYNSTLSFDVGSTQNIVLVQGAENITLGAFVTRYKKRFELPPPFIAEFLLQESFNYESPTNGVQDKYKAKPKRQRSNARTKHLVKYKRRAYFEL